MHHLALTLVNALVAEGGIDAAQLGLVMLAFTTIVGLAGGIMGLVVAFKKLTKPPPIAEQYVTHAELNEAIADIKQEMRSEINEVKESVRLEGMRVGTIIQEHKTTFEQHVRYVHKRNHQLAGNAQSMNNRLALIMMKLGVPMPPHEALVTKEEEDDESDGA